MNIGIVTAWIRDKSIGLIRWVFVFTVKISVTILHFMWRVALSLTGIGLAILLLTMSPIREILQELQSVSKLAIAIGVLIGTILVLAFSLVVTPLQRATETFTPSIARIYREDKWTHLIFIGLALLSLISFVLGGMDIAPVILLPLQIIILSLALDMLRAHHRRIVQALEPNYALERLMGEISRTIIRAEKKTAKRFRVLHNLFKKPSEAADLQINKLALWNSSILENLNQKIDQWAIELTEMANKSISRNEAVIATSVITVIGDMTADYINTCNHILAQQDDDKEFVMFGTIDPEFHRLCQCLNTINRNAVEARDEALSLTVIQAFRTIILSASNIDAQASLFHLAPHSRHALNNMNSCIEIAQREGLLNVARTGSSTLLTVALSSPRGFSPSRIHIPVIESIHQIVMNFAYSAKPSLAISPMQDMLIIAQALVGSASPQDFKFVMRTLLTQIVEFVRVTVAGEKSQTGIGMFQYPIYDISDPLSLSNLLFLGSGLIKVDEEKEWLSPYRHFLDLNELIYRHFRIIAEDMDIGTSFVQPQIGQSIKRILAFYLEIIEPPTQGEVWHSHELVEQIPWYLAFYWSSFSKSTAIEAHIAEQSCEMLSWIGLAYYNASQAQITIRCAKNIVTIINSFCEKAITDWNQFNIADFLMNIWYLRRLAFHDRNDALVHQLDASMNKPEKLPEDTWELVQETLQGRISDLEEEINEVDRRPLDTNDPREYMVHLIIEPPS